MKTDIELQLESYIQFLTNLSESSMDHLERLYDKSIDFRDPINSAVGLRQLEAVYLDLFKQLKQISIQVTGQVAGVSGSFIHWDMSYSFRRKKRNIEGITMIRLNNVGKIIYQRDYWDASHSVYGEFPLLGTVIRFIHKLVCVKPVKSSGTQ